MKYLAFLLTFFSVSVFGQKIETAKIHSSILGQDRDIWIFTPRGYEDNSNRKFEVIYVFDSQAREYFDIVHSTVQFLSGQEFGFIVVGIESPFIENKKQSRNTDFLPKAGHQETIEMYGDYSGGADKFLSFLKSEAIPFIDAKYRTLPERVAIGHSNGATFISYGLLNEPDLFGAYLAISPNFAYDRAQMVARFEKLDPESLKQKKFVFISNSNENSQTSERWKGWQESNKKVIEILGSDPFKQKIVLKTMDFSTSENHSTTFPIGVFNGLKSFIDYQFRTGENIVAYYDRMANKKCVELTHQNVNNFAYECFWNDKPHDALTVIKWAIRKFPDDYNLYDSQGEFYEKIGDANAARESYNLAIKILESRKNDIPVKDYKSSLEYYSNKLSKLN